MLGKPHEPKQHFVTAEECGLKKGFHRTATPEEREARRHVWRTNIARAQTRLAAHRSNQGTRAPPLRRLRSPMTACAKHQGPNTPPHTFDVYPDAPGVPQERPHRRPGRTGWVRTVAI